MDRNREEDINFILCSVFRAEWWEPRGPRDHSSPTGEKEWDGTRWLFVGKTQEPQPYSRTVRIGMISVVPEEEEEDINMESYGEEGYEHEYNGEYTDTEGKEAHP
jgi:hypothetical protein